MICIRCLKFFEHCECAAGPRSSRHPAECQCSMCELGRELGRVSSSDCTDDQVQTIEFRGEES